MLGHGYYFSVRDVGRGLFTSRPGRRPIQADSISGWGGSLGERWSREYPAAGGKKVLGEFKKRLAPGPDGSLSALAS